MLKIPILHLTAPDQYAGSVFSFNEIMISEIAELIIFYSHKHSMNQFIRTCFNLLDAEKLVGMGEIEKSLERISP